LIHQLYKFSGAALFVTALSFANTCPTASLQTYETTVDGPGCTVGSVLFNNFQYQTFASGFNVPVPATGVMLTPLDDAHGAGFKISFSGGLTAYQDANDSEIQYTATAVGPDTLDDVYSAVGGTVTGPAQDRLVEDLCPSIPPSLPPNSTCALNTGVINMILSGSQTLVSTSESFAPSEGLAVLKDIQALACPPGQACGTATVDFVINQVSTPEPGEYGVLAIALAVIAAIRYRRSKITL